MLLWAALAPASAARAEISQRPGMIGLLEVPKLFGRPDRKVPSESKSAVQPGFVSVWFNPRGC